MSAEITTALPPALFANDAQSRMSRPSGLLCSGLLSLMFFAQAIASARTQQQPPPSLAPPNSVYRAGNGVTKPELISKVEPVYSNVARKLRAEGLVVLYIVVAPDGSAQRPRVMQSLGYGLDEKAIEAVQKWRFSPGMKGDTPVSVAATVEVHFRLGPQSNSWHSSLMKFPNTPGAQPPIAADGAMPKPAHEASDESAVLEFTVDPTGAVKNVHPIHGSESATKLLSGHLAGWKFQPAIKDGQAIEMTGRVRFIKGQGDEDAKLALTLPGAAGTPAPQAAEPAQNSTRKMDWSTPGFRQASSGWVVQPAIRNAVKMKNRRACRKSRQASGWARRR